MRRFGPLLDPKKYFSLNPAPIDQFFLKLPLNNVDPVYQFWQKNFVKLPRVTPRPLTTFQLCQEPWFPSRLHIGPMKEMVWTRGLILTKVSGKVPRLHKASYTISSFVRIHQVLLDFIRDIWNPVMTLHVLQAPLWSLGGHWGFWHSWGCCQRAKKIHKKFFLGYPV